MSARYQILLTPARIGWTAAVAHHPEEDRIGMDGPIFWRPTRDWAIVRADRHVQRRLAMHTRERQAETRFYEAGS